MFRRTTQGPHHNSLIPTRFNRIFLTGPASRQRAGKECYEHDTRDNEGETLRNFSGLSARTYEFFGDLEALCRDLLEVPVHDCHWNIWGYHEKEVK